MVLRAVTGGRQLEQPHRSITSWTLPLQELSLGRIRTSLLGLQGVNELSPSLHQ